MTKRNTKNRIAGINRSVRKGVFLSTAVSTTLASIPVSAQDALDFLLEEIIITAQKREQSLQEVPLSVTAFTREDIERSGIVKLEDYAALTPGLSVEPGDDELSYGITIRGISALGGTQNSYGFYLDEFELTGGSSETVSADLADVERIEVLRGPQGTTFGRNVIAGAINLTSIRPRYDEGIFGTFEGGVESYEGRNARGSINIPLVAGKSALRLTGSYRASDGHIDNSGESDQKNDFERMGLRANLLVDLTDRFVINAAAAYHTLDQGRPNTVFDGKLIGEPALIRDAMDAGFHPFYAPGTLPASPKLFPDNNDRVATDTKAFLDASTTLFTLRGEYDFDTFSIISVSGYIDTNREQRSDFDNSNFNLIVSETPKSESDYWSTELRAQSGETSPLSWVIGGFFSKSDSNIVTETSTGSDAFSITAGAFPDNTVIFANDFKHSAESSAIFGELGYDITPEIAVLGGVRYNKDSSEATISDVIDLPGAGGPLPDDEGSTSSKKVTWRSSISYQPNGDLNYYFTVAQGYRAGGLQLFSPDVPDFGTEEALNYEIGAKTFLFDRRVNLNIAAFYTDWKDVQILTFDFSIGREITDNVGEAEVKGIDIDLRTNVSKELTLIAGLSYIDTEIKEYINPAGGDFSGSPLPNTPEFSASLIADYERPLFDEIDGFIRATYIHTGERLESVVDAELREFFSSYDRVDLQLGLRSDKWSVELYGDNIFDEIYAAGILPSGFSLSGSEIASPPRVFGIRTIFDF